MCFFFTEEGNFNAFFTVAQNVYVYVSGIEVTFKFNRIQLFYISAVKVKYSCLKVAVDLVLGKAGKLINVICTVENIYVNIISYKSNISVSIKRAVVPFEKLRPFAVSRRGDALTDVMEWVRFITTGIMSIHCAITITSTVKRRPSEPKMPFLENSI